MAKAVPIHKLTRPDAPFIDSASVIQVRLGEVMEFAPAALDPANVTELHDMRIAAKRLRYTLEVFTPVLPKERAEPVLKMVAVLQEHLGAIHDNDMLVPLLAQALAREETRERKKALRKKAELPPFFAAEGLVPLISRKQAERVILYNAFIAWWQSLPPEAFWRQVSDVVPVDNAGSPQG